MTQFHIPVRSLTLIGGGDLMLSAAAYARSKGIALSAVLAPRHASERLVLDGRIAEPAFREVLGSALVLADDINAWRDLPASCGPFGANAALCFGPAWIFAPHVRALFEQGMYNVNPIPVPRYLGGAHYTWQILNGDRQGGCVVQAITDRLDRGPILRRIDFELPPDARTPQDYYREYTKNSLTLVEQFIDDMQAGRTAHEIPFDTVEADRLYLPRLSTIANGWIDWSWTAEEIERFVCAFDEPYAGAASFLEGREFRLKGAERLPGSEKYANHPFLAGLVVRKLDGAFSVATRNGLIRFKRVVMSDNRDAYDEIREGQRFTTPSRTLEEAREWKLRLSGGEPSHRTVK